MAPSTLKEASAAGGTASCRQTELVNTFGPEYRMLLIGAGQLTEYLATMALFSRLCGHGMRPARGIPQRLVVAGATVVSDMPDDVVLAFKPDRRSCVVALTHDPKLDDLALLEALKTEAFYVGAIGSRRNNEARQQRMIEHFEHDRRQLCSACAGRSASTSAARRRRRSRSA